MYTAPCAAWHTPVFLLNSRLGRFTAARFRSGSESPHVRPASLLPKLRDHYAEFLDHVSLVHLRLLASPTCVGLRYGRSLASTQSFSRVSTPQNSGSAEASPSPSALGPKSYCLRRPIHKAAPASFHGPSGVQRLKNGAGILTGLPSATPLGPRLRTRLTLR